MAITMIMEWPGVTAAEYDEVRELVGWEHEPADGGLSHIATVTPGGLRVTDVWESAEHFQRFADERLMSAVHAVGITTEPQVEIFPNHAWFVPGLS
jgi:hypothetical protein